MKRFIALILATVMLLALCACTGGNGKTVLEGQDPNAPLTADDVISIMIPSSASWPIKQDYVLWDYMEEGSGATLEIIPFPDVDAATKLPLMFTAREELPDLLAFSTSKGAIRYAGEGIIALDDLADFMPSYNAWLDSLSEEEYDVIVKNRKASDGKVYYTPGTGREGKTRMRAWLYREDIFKKHNIKAPETFDELYDACKKLKELYPDSYPFCMRSGFSNINVIGSSWKPNFRYGVYYDFENEKWSYGARESEVMLDIVTYLKRMVDEKLIPSDFFTINVASWQELVSTDRGFIMPEYQVRIDFFNNIARAKNPEYTMAAMTPPKADNGMGVAMVNKYNNDPMGFAIPNTGKPADIANAFRYLNWFYSDEGTEIISWGREGETYEVVDGKRQFILPNEGDNAKVLYGFQTVGTFTRLDPAAALSAQSETIAETRDMVLEHTLPYMNPTQWLSFNEAEQKIVDEYFAACMTYSEEMFAKFMLGQEPISNFDKFVENFGEMGVDKLLGAYESAYNRVK